MAKRTLDGFFHSPSTKKARLTDRANRVPNEISEASKHPSYPWAIPYYSPEVIAELEDLRHKLGKEINDKLDLDLIYFQPFIPKNIEREVFEFLRSNLFFYRVRYSIKRFGKETQINTPRYTTVFGVDETSRFIAEPPSIVQAADVTTPIPVQKYRCDPRPIPECLDILRRVTEAATKTKYNFVLVNYYANGADSISYHSDDERFLGPEPAIASFSLGAKRDFLMKHKPIPPKNGVTVPELDPIKLPLQSGDMVLMRGRTQSNWLHSIPKRKGVEADKGRLNITLRRALNPGGTENYYRYNVGGGGVYRWNNKKAEMVPWTPTGP
ncbi:putative dna repair family protein [Phaeomoniella chlamydospora]|uniref:Putative dna repair family protein n=1 Tax=Phaeomoniella chlamydospora TaxID=158046 RepID=A0A0G2FQ84_PHACM|nr:putative dna repair family protein [Phaeomoniella chlamydospora]